MSGYSPSVEPKKAESAAIRSLSEPLRDRLKFVVRADAILDRQIANSRHKTRP